MSGFGVNPWKAGDVDNVSSMRQSKRPRTGTGRGWTGPNKWQNKGRRQPLSESDTSGTLEVSFSLSTGSRVAVKSRYNELTDLKKLNLRTTLRKLPTFVTRNVKDGVFKCSDAETKTLSPNDTKKRIRAQLPESLWDALMPFQRNGIATIVQRGGKVLLGDEMGLGKTLQALSVASYYNTEWPLLVVCPSSLRHTWAAEIEKWLEIGPESIQIISSGKQRPNNLICILSYDLATKMTGALMEFKIIIADESHYLKSPDTKRTQALIPAIQHARHALLLSGTPALSRPIELFSQLNALQPSMFDSRSAFGIRYCNGFQNKFGWDFTGSSNLPELHMVMANSILVRRLKRDVLDQLPAKTRQQVYVEPVPQLKKELDALENERAKLDVRLRSADSNSKSAIEMQKRALTVKMYQITGQCKLPESLAYLNDLLEKKIKTLVFAHHREILDGICANLSKRKVRHIRIDGSTPQALRQELCNKFQTDDNSLAAVLSITAAGVGLTLHSAATVVFFELAWNPGQLLQAEDRAHRMGQQRSVDIKYMVAKGTADQSQWSLLQKKIGVVGQSVNGTNDTMALHDDRQENADAQNQLPEKELLCGGKIHGLDDKLKVGDQAPPNENEFRPCPICGDSFKWFLVDDHASECVQSLADAAFSDNDEIECIEVI